MFQLSDLKSRFVGSLRLSADLIKKILQPIESFGEGFKEGYIKQQKAS